MIVIPFGTIFFSCSEDKASESALAGETDSRLDDSNVDTSETDSSETAETAETAETGETVPLVERSFSDFVTTRFWGSQPNEGLGTFFTVDDYDGDGLPDILAAGPYGDSERGIMELYLGADTDLFGENFSSYRREEGALYYGHMPEQVAFVNLTGDSELTEDAETEGTNEDFVYGTPYAGTEDGRVCFADGNSPDDFSTEVCYWGSEIERDSGSSTWLGTAVRALGDTNGDDYEDVGIAAIRENTVYIVLGGEELGDLKGGALRGPDGTETFGASLAALGDLNDDGKTELAVADPEAEKITVVSLPASETEWEASEYQIDLAGSGDSYVAFQYTGIPNAYNIAFTDPNQGTDLNNNGKTDLIVTSTAYGSKGEVLAFYDVEDDLLSGATGKTKEQADLSITGVHSGESLGYADGMAVGDFNDDGYADLAVASRGERREGGVYPGAIYVFLGSEAVDFESGEPISLSVEDCSFVIDGGIKEVLPAAYGGCGIASLRTGDVDGDGISDLLVGVPALSRDIYYADGDTDEEPQVGAIVVLHGGAGSFAGG